jgi:hypothetical protein
MGVLMDQKNANFEPRKGQSRPSVTPIPRHYGALTAEAQARVAEKMREFVSSQEQRTSDELTMSARV